MVHGVLWGTADLQKEWDEKEPGAPGERTFVGFQRKVGRVVGRERNGGKLQPQTAAEHTLSTLGMNLLDIIFAPTRATVGPRARARGRVRGKGKGQGQGQGQSTVRGQGER